MRLGPSVAVLLVSSAFVLVAPTASAGVCIENGWPETQCSQPGPQLPLVKPCTKELPYSHPGPMRIPWLCPRGRGG